MINHHSLPQLKKNRYTNGNKFGKLMTNDNARLILGFTAFDASSMPTVCSKSFTAAAAAGYTFLLNKLMDRNGNEQ